MLGRVAALAHQLPAAMAVAADDTDVVALDSALPQQLVDVVAARCAALAARLQ